MGMRSIHRKEAAAGVLFVLPFLVGFAVFHFAPLLSSLLFSLTDLSFITKISDLRFVGLQNYATFFNDAKALLSFEKSAYYAAAYVPLVMISSLVLAIAVNAQLYFRKWIRLMLFMPYVSNIVAIAIVWAIILEVHEGPLNSFLRAMGIDNPPMWLLGMHTVLPTIAMIVAWQNLGFNLITFLAALQGIPSELYEAATVDGAGYFRRLLRITLPMISPTTFFLTISALLISLQNFGPIQVLTQGGPGSASTTISINLYQETFGNFRIGYACAQSVILLFIIMSVTIFIWRAQKKWVNY